MILANIEEIVNHIINEREEAPTLIVIVHTHPVGIAHPSELNGQRISPACNQTHKKIRA